jgi:hypothetical protein
MTDPGAAPEPQARPERPTPDQQLLFSAYGGDLYGIQGALKLGADINAVHPETGLSALHIAVGTNDLPVCRYLIEQCHAAFFPDRFGRWPTLVAAECGVSDELGDYVAAMEARFLEQKAS